MTTEAKTMLCPMCAEEIKAAAKKCKHCGEWLVKDGPVTSPAKTTKDCPHCGDEIKINAKKCKHCKEFLTDKAVELEVVRVDTPYPIIAQVIPLLAAVILFIIYKSNIEVSSFNPRKVANIILAIDTAAIALSIVFVFLDAKAINIGRSKDNEKQHGPLFWSISCFLLWLVCFPIYFFNRQRIDVKRYNPGVVIVIVLMLTISAVVAYNKYDFSTPSYLL